MQQLELHCLPVSGSDSGWILSFVVREMKFCRKKTIRLRECWEKMGCCLERFALRRGQHHKLTTIISLEHLAIIGYDLCGYFPFLFIIFHLSDLCSVLCLLGWPYQLNLKYFA